MIVINLLEAVVPGTEIEFQNANSETIMKWKQGYDIDVLDVSFRYKKIKSLEIANYKRLKVEVGAGRRRTFTQQEIGSMKTRSYEQIGVAE